MTYYDLCANNVIAVAFFFIHIMFKGINVGLFILISMLRNQSTETINANKLQTGQHFLSLLRDNCNYSLFAYQFGVRAKLEYHNEIQVLCHIL